MPGLAQVVGEHDVDQHLQLGRLLGKVEHQLGKAAQVGQAQVHKAVGQAGVLLGIRSARTASRVGTG